MSQSDRLPTIKKIELPSKAMKPPLGSKAVDTLPDGTVVWEGPVFAGNPYFQDHGAKDDDGHTRVPVMDPARPGEQKWRRAKGTGEAITPIFRAKRREKIVRFIMKDDGNGNAGPRPVPGLTAEERTRVEHEKNRSEYEREFFAAAQAEGIPAAELVKKLAALGGAPADEVESEEKPKARRGRPPKSPDPDPVAA